MKKNPIPCKIGKIIRENNAKPKPHEEYTAEAPEGKTTACIERNLRKALNHQSPNIVVDSFRVKELRDKSIQSFLIMRLKMRHGIKRIIFVNRKRQVVDINKLIS